MRSSSRLPGLQPLPRGFFHPSPERVAPALLGKVLVRRIGARELRGRIIETEAYLGSGDAAAHAARGLTPRTAPLFGPPGHAYIYLIYGLHWCLNVSTLPEGEAGGVLLRALEPLHPWSAPPPNLVGPGRLTRALQIGPALNRLDLTQPGPLVLTDDGFPPPAVAATPRIGIARAVELPLRFIIPGHPLLSVRLRP